MPRYNVKMDLNVKVTMRDRVKLSADIYRPDAKGAFPVILARTPYDNSGHIGKGKALAGKGYVYVAQDCRGRYDSDGEFYPWHDEPDDGFDTQEWIGKQKWCNGKIGMVGGSYGGLVQWLAAIRGSRHLKCIVPRVCTSSFYDSPNYAGGAFQLALNMMWGLTMTGRSRMPSGARDWQTMFRTLPLIKADEVFGCKHKFWKDWVKHPRYDSYWEQVDIEDKYDRIKVPALIMGGWYDLYSKQTFTNFQGMREHGGSEEARKHTRLIVGAWPHPINTSTQTGDIDFGLDSQAPLEEMELEFLDYWLRGRKGWKKNEPPMRLFIMGANHWRAEHEWPLAHTQWINYNLHSGGHANSLKGNGTLSTDPPEDEPVDRFTYDPKDPVPTIGGNNCCSPNIVPYGPYDQRPAEKRQDVLVYTTPPLKEEMEATGPIVAKLYASSSAPDTDFTAKLCDVFPNGCSMNLCDGIVRARYRKSFKRATLMKPDTVYEFTIDCWVTGNVFKKGHRIRLDISSSNFPRFDRNPNTGHKFGMDAVLKNAKQTIYHNRRYPSHVILPVIPIRGRSE